LIFWKESVKLGIQVFRWKGESESDKDLLDCLEVKSHEDYKYLGTCNRTNQVIDERKPFPYFSLYLRAASSSPAHAAVPSLHRRQLP
jgi:hypothetical protein